MRFELFHGFGPTKSILVPTSFASLVATDVWAGGIFLGN
jgi:hypothetical protein